MGGSLVGRYRNEKDLIREIERKLNLEPSEPHRPDDVKEDLRRQSIEDHERLVKAFQEDQPKVEPPKPVTIEQSRPPAPEYEVLDSNRYENAISAEQWNQIKSCTPLTPQPTQEIAPDVAGSLYVSLVEPSVEAAKAAGHRQVDVELEIPRGSSAFAEFKSIMRSNGYEVDVEAICFRSNGFGYRVVIQW